MSPVRKPRRTVLVAWVAATATALVVALAGCSGPPGTSEPEPGALPAATADDQSAQAPAVEPTRASTGLETPRPRTAQQPALLTAAAATGRVVLVGAAHPGVECVYFQWLPQGPALPQGAAFVVDHVQVVPELWKPVGLACKEDPVRCDRAELTAEAVSCAVAVERTDGPRATGPTGASASLIGSLRCTAPVTRAQCAALTAGLVARADDPGSALSLDDPIPADDAAGPGDAASPGETAGPGTSPTPGG